MTIGGISEEKSFSRLVGVERDSICLGRLITFFCALLISDFVFPLRSILFEKIPFSFTNWTSIILTCVLVAGLVLLFFRFIQNKWIAALFIATAYAIVRTVLNLILYPKIFYPNQRIQLALLTQYLSYAWVWAFLFIIGLSLAARHLKPVWFALVAGYFMAMIIDLVFIAVVQIMGQPKFNFILKEQLINTLSWLVSSIVFGGLFWAGLNLPWSEWKERELALGLEPRPGEAAPFRATQVPPERSSLFKAADFKVISSHLRPAAFGSIVFGVIAIGLGASLAERNPINAFLALIGIFLLIEGIWLLTSPGPKGFIVDGIALIILGVWNILVTIANSSSGGDAFTGFFVLGIWQIIWGFQSFSRYKRFAYLSSEKPSKESLLQLEEVVKAIMASSYRNSSDIIEFKVKTAFKDLTWKGTLMEDSALFVAGKNAIIPVRKDEVKLTLKGEVSGLRPQKGTLLIGKQKIIGSISRESLERLREWKPSLT